MSIAFVNHRHTVVLIGALAALSACEKREKPADKTTTESAPLPSPTATPALLSGTMGPSTQHANLELKDTVKAARPEMKKVIEEYEMLGARPIATLSVEEARKQPMLEAAVRAVLKKEGKSKAEPLEIAKVMDKEIPSPSGSNAARVYTPKTDAKKPLPMVLYFHGGGWVIGDLDKYDASARALAKHSEAIVVSADYRRAPEHKFPAAHDDAWAAYEWITKNAASIGGDPKRVAVAGEGAGANLAVNVAITARDKGVRLPMHQLLIYPIAQTSMDTRSYKDWANAMPLDKATMGWFFDKALRSPADRSDPRIALVHADLKDLPPATIILAEIDPLHADGEMLHQALESAGVKSEKKSYDGVTHQFFGTGAYVAEAKTAEEYAGGRLKSALER